MPRFQLRTKVFIAPNLFPEGAVIDYDGPLGTAFMPVDEEGQALLEQFYKDHPNAALHPTEFLPRTMDGKGPGEDEIRQATASMVALPPKEEGVDMSGAVAMPGKKALPGLSEGGKAIPTAKR